MNSGYEQPVGPTVFMIFGPNMSSNIINIYIYIYLYGCILDSN